MKQPTKKRKKKYARPQLVAPLVAPLLYQILN